MHYLQQSGELDTCIIMFFQLNGDYVNNSEIVLYLLFPCHRASYFKNSTFLIKHKQCPLKMLKSSYYFLKVKPYRNLRYKFCLCDFIQNDVITELRTCLKEGLSTVYQMLQLRQLTFGSFKMLRLEHLAKFLHPIIHFT